MTDTRQSRFCLTARILSAFLIIAFCSTTILPPGFAQQIGLTLPIPGTMVNPSPVFTPVLLKGMTVHPENPLRFDFIVEGGDSQLHGTALKHESQRLVNYFLASMTVPRDDLWVNLSPTEHDRIIPDELAKTELGRDLLAQDYILKQLAASLMHPDQEPGRQLWERIHTIAREQYGVTDIPTDTFNKVWIMPESASVYEYNNTVYITDTHLKVMLDSDYQRAQAPQDPGALENSQTEERVKQIIREVILPQIESEVNHGKNFAPVRQIYHSLILAKWYKETVHNSVMSQVYIDQNKTAGIETGDPGMKQRIYERYMEAYKKGAFNIIKEEYDDLSQTVIPRQYFSGGVEYRQNFALKGNGSPGQGKDPYALKVTASPLKQTLSNPEQSMLMGTGNNHPSSKHGDDLNSTVGSKNQSRATLRQKFRKFRNGILPPGVVPSIAPLGFAPMISELAPILFKIFFAPVLRAIWFVAEYMIENHPHQLDIIGALGTAYGLTLVAAAHPELSLSIFTGAALGIRYIFVKFKRKTKLSDQKISNRISSDAQHAKVPDQPSASTDQHQQTVASTTNIASDSAMLGDMAKLSVQAFGIFAGSTAALIATAYAGLQNAPQAFLDNIQWMVDALPYSPIFAKINAALLLTAFQSAMANPGYLIIGVFYALALIALFLPYTLSEAQDYVLSDASTAYQLRKALKVIASEGDKRDILLFKHLLLHPNPKVIHQTMITLQALEATDQELITAYLAVLESANKPAVSNAVDFLKKQQLSQKEIDHIQGLLSQEIEPWKDSLLRLLLKTNNPDAATVQTAAGETQPVRVDEADITVSPRRLPELRTQDFFNQLRKASKDTMLRLTELLHDNPEEFQTIFKEFSEINQTEALKLLFMINQQTGDLYSEKLRMTLLTVFASPSSRTPAALNFLIKHRNAIEVPESTISALTDGQADEWYDYKKGSDLAFAGIAALMGDQAFREFFQDMLIEEKELLQEHNTFRPHLIPDFYLMSFEERFNISLKGEFDKKQQNLAKQTPDSGKTLPQEQDGSKPSGHVKPFSGALGLFFGIMPQTMSPETAAGLSWITGSSAGAGLHSINPVAVVFFAVTALVVLWVTRSDRSEPAAIMLNNLKEPQPQLSIRKTYRPDKGRLPLNKQSKLQPGGIDMNEIGIDRRGEDGLIESGEGIMFEMQGMEDLLNMDIQGFTPVIIDMTPLNSVLPLLGLAPMEKGIKFGQEEIEQEFELSRI